MTISFKSYAKINLSLEILGKRPDGFHELESVLQEIDVYDEIQMDVLQEHKISIDFLNMEAPCPLEDNLIYKALSQFLIKTNLTNTGFSIKLHKNIPIGGGLAGGSSNAIYCLKQANQYFGHPLEIDELMFIASSIGSDTPFFLYGKRALCKGRGEIVTPLKSQNKDVLLLLPSIFCSTAKIFKALNINEEKIHAPLQSNNETIQLSNDLEKPAFSLFPELKDIKETLDEIFPSQNLMSGSGSSFFALAPKEELLEKQNLISHYGKSIITQFI